jgi:hypothetical protein
MGSQLPEVSLFHSPYLSVPEKHDAKNGSIEEFVGKFRWEEGKEQEEGV